MGKYFNKLKNKTWKMAEIIKNSLRIDEVWGNENFIEEQICWDYFVGLQ